MADGYFSNLRSRAEDVRDSAGKYGRDARDSAEKYGRRASSSLRDAGETIRDRGDDARGELAKRYAGSYARDGRDAALDMASQLRDATRSRPLMAIGIAVAATWVISTMLRSSKR